MIIDSYLMIGGIGYVWIMRVFMTVALAAPLLSNSRLTSCPICSSMS